MSANPLQAGLFKYVAPALIAAAGSVAVTYIKTEADLSKSKLGFESLASSHNDLMTQVQKDHDELESLRGAVSVLTTSVVVRPGTNAVAVEETQATRSHKPVRGETGHAAPKPVGAAPTPGAAGAPVASGQPPAESAAAVTAKSVGTGKLALQGLSETQMQELKRPRVFSAKRVPTNFEDLIRAAPVKSQP